MGRRALLLGGSFRYAVFLGVALVCLCVELFYDDFLASDAMSGSNHGIIEVTLNVSVISILVQSVCKALLHQNLGESNRSGLLSLEKERSREL